MTHFLNMFTSKYRKHMNLTPGLMEALRQYSWPGNVRELHNFLDRYTAFGDVALESLGDAGKTELLFPTCITRGLPLRPPRFSLRNGSSGRLLSAAAGAGATPPRLSA